MRKIILVLLFLLVSFCQNYIFGQEIEEEIKNTKDTIQFEDWIDIHFEIDEMHEGFKTIRSSIDSLGLLLKANKDNDSIVALVGEDVNRISNDISVIKDSIFDLIYKTKNCFVELNNQIYSSDVDDGFKRHLTFFEYEESGDYYLVVTDNNIFNYFEITHFELFSKINESKEIGIIYLYTKDE